MAERRVKKPKEFSHLFDKLVTSDPAEIENSPFETDAELMAFAAALGYKLGRKVPFEKADEPIRWDVFENKRLDTLVHLIALADDGDPGVLTSADEGERKLKIFEAYANGGLAEMDRIANRSGTVLNNLVEVVLAEYSPDGGTTPELDLAGLLKKKTGAI